MGEVREWMWLVKTVEGSFFIVVVGEWAQEEAATRV